MLPIASMRRSTLSLLGLAVFGLLLVSFLVRGFGRFVLGRQLAWDLGVAVALVAAGLVVTVVGFWTLAWVGVTALVE